jgi:two-component system sensor histidine kinase KdpD
MSESEEAVRRELEELRAHVARRAAFVAMLAHDVRTPLAAVIGSVQTLQQRGVDLSAGQRGQLLDVIRREADRLAALLEEAFDTARIDTGTFTYAFADVSVADLVGEAVAAANASGATGVVTNVQTALPSVDGDRHRLRQVLANLIENAVKFSPPGDPVVVGAALVDGRVQVSVTDHGEGIAPEHQKLIFEQFGQVPDTGRPGSGLGLYISRAIAEAHGGTLGVTSAPGEGATFTLTLPPASPV